MSYSILPKQSRKYSFPAIVSQYSVYYLDFYSVYSGLFFYFVLSVDLIKLAKLIDKKIYFIKPTQQSFSARKNN